MDLVCEAEAAEINRKMVYRTTKGMALQGTWLLEPILEKSTWAISTKEGRTIVALPSSGH